MMFDQKNVFSQYVGYFLIGFFLLIIIISFGMPDVSGCGSDRSAIAVVNGQKVNTLDFVRYRDTKFAQFRNQKMDSFILDNYILELLLVQKAKKTGFDVTEERITRFVKNTPDFKNPSTGKFDPEYFQAILRNNRLSLAEFEKLIKKDFALSEYRFFLNIGGASSKEDILVKNTVNNSTIQIQYAFLSSDELKNRYKGNVSVSDAEIDAEIKSNNVKVSDPTTDRARIRKQLEDKKLEKLKNDLAEKINSIASSGGSFASANSVLNGRISRSSKFKIGEPVKTDEKDPKPVTALNNSAVFNDKCLALGIDKTSPAIITATGIYIYTPVLKTIPTVSAGQEIDKKLADAGDYMSAGMITQNLIKDIKQKSKIRKNLKTD